MVVVHSYVKSPVDYFAVAWMGHFFLGSPWGDISNCFNLVHSKNCKFCKPSCSRFSTHARANKVASNSPNARLEISRERSKATFFACGYHWSINSWINPGKGKVTYPTCNWSCAHHHRMRHRACKAYREQAAWCHFQLTNMAGLALETVFPCLKGTWKVHEDASWLNSKAT